MVVQDWRRMLTFITGICNLTRLGAGGEELFVRVSLVQAGKANFHVEVQMCNSEIQNTKWPDAKW